VVAGAEPPGDVGRPHGGCTGLSEAEKLTAASSLTRRRQLWLPRRLADTTMRDAVCKLSLDAIRIPGEHE
jgi:hypothetical protein